MYGLVCPNWVGSGLADPSFANFPTCSLIYNNSIRMLFVLIWLTMEDVYLVTVVG